MKRFFSFLTLTILILLGLAVSSVLGQTDRPFFEPVQQIGEQPPQGVVYNRPLDQLLWVAPGGVLQLVDATSFEPTHTLYEGESYTTYTFSDDGGLLAVALDLQVDLWDTREGELLASFIPDGILGLTGPLQFSDDNRLLLVNSIVRAPQALRRSENDTSILPWLWDVPNALGTARSSLANNAEAVAFFDYRNGFILGPNDYVVAALAARLNILNVGVPDNPEVAAIESTRFEPDPVNAWISQQNAAQYVAPQGRDALVQIDPTSGQTVEMPLGNALSEGQIAPFERLLLAPSSRSVGEPVSNNLSPLARLMTGRERFVQTPLTITLIDVVDPQTQTAERSGFLLFTFDETTGRGFFSFLRPEGLSNIVLSPDGSQIMFRRGGQIEVYDVASGALIRTITPAYADSMTRRTVLDFSPDGRSIINGFQRFDLNTGEIVAENLHYTPGFDEFFFNEDATRLTTLRYLQANEETGQWQRAEWWQWDLRNGDIVRRETVELRGPIVAASADGERFLTRIGSPVQTDMVAPAGDGNPGLELVEIGVDDRPGIRFDPPPGRTIEQILPSPDWNHVLVVYAPYQFSTHFPGNEIALYSLERGLLHFIAGDDLPSIDGRSYRWLNNEQVVVEGSNPSSGVPDRVYGVEYHPSGLPACLVAEFPERFDRWVPVWERRVNGLREDRLNELSQDMCAALPTSFGEIEEILTTPTPTRAPTRAAVFNPTPPVLAGVPACVTRSFPGDAEDYGDVWRAMSAGLSQEELLELEEVLCEGLTSVGSTGGFGGGVRGRGVMIIDIDSGERLLSRTNPPTEASEPGLSVSIALDAFEQERRFRPELAKISDNERLLAYREFDGTIQVERFAVPYRALSADATATVAVVLSQTVEPPRIALLPTVTPTSMQLGEPRPTLTPTITPTPPPPPESDTALPNAEAVQTLCEADATRFSIGNPPVNYNASGRLLTTLPDSSLVWVMDPATGRIVADESLPACHLDGTCNLSFDENWLLEQDPAIAVSRADGTERRVLYTPEERPAWPTDIFWRDFDNLEYRYRSFGGGELRFETTFIQRYDPTSGTLSEPFEPSEMQVSINELPTTVLATQPVEERFVLARTGFQSGRGTGYKYYVYDRQTEAADYFARLASAGDNNLIATWHPLGIALYYRYPEPDTPWYIYTPDDGQHRILGDLPDGIWSRDGRYRVAWTLPEPEERALLVERGEPVPKIRVWDSETGLTRLYCVPGTGDQPYAAPFVWSPDNRYLTFRVNLPEDAFEANVVEGEVRIAGAPRDVPPPAQEDQPPPTPTLEGEAAPPTPQPTATLLPAASFGFSAVESSQPAFEAARARTFVLDTETGTITELSDEAGPVSVWLAE